nr:hypothetical protein [Rhodococcus sp. 06-156-3b]
MGSTVLGTVTSNDVTPVSVSATVPADYKGADALVLQARSVGVDDLVVKSPSLSVVAPIVEPEPEPEPQPEPEPEEPVTQPDWDAGKAVAQFLGQGDDLALVALARQHAGIVTEMCRAYTRGGGFDPDPNAEVQAVIVTAAARLVSNPDQVNQTIGNVTVQGWFRGFSLPELFVLNRYRVRAS